MNLLAPIVLALAALVSCSAAHATPAAAHRAPTRCGWFDNPTPGNAWLTDRRAQWVVGIQGGHQAAGDWPDFSDRQWVSTNGHYGYGCACLQVLDDARSHQIRRILRAWVRPLAACEHDPALPARRPLTDPAQR